MGKIIKTNRVVVDINVNKGLYHLNDAAAVGKTYLFKVLSDLNARGDMKITLITYNKNQTSEDIVRIISESDAEIIFLDRFDLYYDRKIVEVLNKKQEALCLVDLKDSWLQVDCGCGYISLMLENPSSIKVGY